MVDYIEKLSHKDRLVIRNGYRKYFIFRAGAFDSCGEIFVHLYLYCFGGHFPDYLVKKPAVKDTLSNVVGLYLYLGLYAQLQIIAGKLQDVSVKINLYALQSGYC